MFITFPRNGPKKDIKKYFDCGDILNIKLVKNRVSDSKGTALIANKSMILFGDFAQHPPVNSHSLSEKTSITSNNKVMADAG